MKKEHEKRQAQKKTPRKITSTYLHNAGLYYLQRFSASSGHFKRVMTRKVTRSCNHHTDQDFDACIHMLDEIIQKFIAVDLLNDTTYARGMVTSLRRRGLSYRAINIRLQSKKLSSHDIKTALEAHDSEEDQNSELLAALRQARRKRIGPFSRTEKTDALYQKHLASLARYGFSYDIAQKVLLMPSDEAEESLMTHF